MLKSIQPLFLFGVFYWISFFQGPGELIQYLQFHLYFLMWSVSKACFSVGLFAPDWDITTPCHHFWCFSPFLASFHIILISLWQLAFVLLWPVTHIDRSAGSMTAYSRKKLIKNIAFVSNAVKKLVNIKCNWSPSIHFLLFIQVLVAV